MGLERYLVIASGLHVALFILLFIFQLIGDFKWFSSKTNKQVKMIQSAVRVDIVGMPKYTVQELKKMHIAPAQSASETESKPQEIVKKSPDNEKSNLDFKKFDKKVDLNQLLKNLSNKKVINSNSQKNIQNTKIKKSLDKVTLRNLVLEGNKISKGTAVVGDMLGKEQTIFEAYISNLPNFIRPNWKLPSYLMERELKCRVRIYIAGNGKILKTELFESSGVPEFDDKALRAVRDSNPLPAPLSDILGRVSSGEVILGFPL